MGSEAGGRRCAESNQAQHSKFGQRADRMNFGAEPQAKRNPMKRTAVLLYGSLVYAFFLITFLWAIGFVEGIVVPKGINDGTQNELIPSILINVSLLGLFGVQHCIMARPWFKKRWTKIISPAAERATFVLVTCAILQLIFAKWQPLQETVWSFSGAAATTICALSYLGFGIVLVSTFMIDHFDLFGIKQAVNYFRGKPHVDPKFHVASIYRYTRHPLYLGFMLAFWAAPVMTQGHMLFAGVCTAFILVAVRFEEHDLISAHGEDYVDYKRRVPMILPLRGRSYDHKPSSARLASAN